MNFGLVSISEFCYHKQAFVRRAQKERVCAVMIIVKVLRIIVMYAGLFFVCMFLVIAFMLNWPMGVQMLFAFCTPGVAVWLFERRWTLRQKKLKTVRGELIAVGTSTSGANNSGGRISKKSRLDTWRKIISAKRETELDEVTAGRDAEQAVRSLVSDHLTRKTASIFHSKRVPRDTQTLGKGRYEIDLIVISHQQISAIEIKNWSGRLRVEGDRWIQVRRSGDEISHENPLAKNREKLDRLCSLLKEKNIQIPAARLCRVIFWNRNLHVPLEIAESNEIVMSQDLDRFLSQQKAVSFAEKFLISVLEFCLDQEASMIAADGFFKAVPSRDYAATTRAISDLETFDKIELLGGRVLSGDLLELRVGQDRLPLKPVESGTEIRVQCSRNTIILFISAIFRSSPLMTLSKPFKSLRLDPKDKVLFHRAGEQKPEEIDFARIVRMVRG